MDENYSHVVYSKNVVEFATVAAEYCGFVEKTDKFQKKDFIDKSLKLFPLLYLKSALIPEIEKCFEDDNEKFVTEEDYNSVKQMIESKLGTHEQFIDIFEPERQESEDKVNVSLAECYADIYQDLKDFNTNYQIGVTETMNDALWECKQNFEKFWGPRLIITLSALHNIYYSGDDLCDEDNVKNNNSEFDYTKVNTDNWLINRMFTQNNKTK